MKAHAAQRYVIWHFLQPVFNNLRVREFPKSGGTWLCQMLSELFVLPYPRNTSLPMTRCIQHEHYYDSSGYRTIHLIRDGRDVMTSAYFHFLISNKDRPPALLHKWRSLVSTNEYGDIIRMMPKFIKVFHEHYKVGGQRTNWSDHVLGADTNNSICVKYEDLLNDAKSELLKICDWYQYKPKISFEQVVEKYSFKNQASRNPGVEDGQSFLRKGIKGDWRNYFNEEATELYDALHGKALQFYGYV